MPADLTNTQRPTLSIEPGQENLPMIHAGARSFAALVRDGKTTRSLYLNLQDPEVLKEFGEVIHRAINTWDKTPAWVQEIHNQLEAIPNAHNAHNPGN